MDKELASLRITCAAYAERVHALEDALQPFIEVNSSDDYFMLRVRSADIRHARKLVAPKYAEETPQWMIELAERVAFDFTSEDQIGVRARLQRAVIDAMKEAAREVALYFAANPEKAKEVPRA